MDITVGTVTSKGKSNNNGIILVWVPESIVSVDVKYGSTTKTVLLNDILL